jgi:hypothetical protein
LRLSRTYQTQKSPVNKRFTGLSWIFLDLKMVEAAGIEPASENSSGETTTCVVSPMISHPPRHRLTKAEVGQFQNFAGHPGTGVLN